MKFDTQADTLRQRRRTVYAGCHQQESRYKYAGSPGWGDLGVRTEPVT